MPGCGASLPVSALPFPAHHGDIVYMVCWFGQDAQSGQVRFHMGICRCIIDARRLHGQFRFYASFTPGAEVSPLLAGRVEGGAVTFAPYEEVAQSLAL